MTPSFWSRRRVAGTALLGVIAAAGVLVPTATTLTLVESVSGDPALFALVVAGLYLVRPLFALPTTPIAVVVGYGYGIALGVPIALAGVVTTVVPVFLVARWFVDERDGTERSAPGSDSRLLERTETAVRRYYDAAGPIRGVVASRLAPIPSDVSTCAAAASGVRLRYLLIGTAVGELPWTIAAVVVGASAATVTTGGVGELGVALTVGCATAAALLLAGPAYRALRTDSRADDSHRATDG